MALDNEKTYETYYRGDKVIYTVTKNMTTGIWYLRDGDKKIVVKGSIDKVNNAKTKLRES